MPTAVHGRARSLVSLPVDFANTVACPGCRGGDALATPGTTRAWVRSKLRGSAWLGGPADLAPLRQLRDEVGGLLRASANGVRPSSATLRSFNRSLRRPTVPEPLRWDKDGWSHGGVPARLRTGDLVALVARTTAQVLAGPDRRRVRSCQGPGCVHFLFARSSRQLWCSPSGCGNRVRVQRHYRRTRSCDDTEPSVSLPELRHVGRSLTARPRAPSKR